MKFFLLLLAFGGAIDLSVGAPLQVFLAPNGDDAKDGLTADRAIQTLERAQQILAREHRDAEVRIAPGTYSGQTVKWTLTMPDRTIAFLPASERKELPVFDGGGKGTWFLLAGHAKGAATNLVFRSLQVQNYETAIAFHGDRNKAESSSRGNVVEGCVFLHVGEGSTAAVRLVNSSGNRIADSTFQSIVRRSSPGLLHAIYAAHGSSENLILHNRFETCCGDPVRFRDGSNGNTVERNTFVNAGVVAAVTDWFCDHERESDCTKPTAECPSWNNVVKDNLVGRSYLGAPLKAVTAFSDRLPTGCTRPSPNEQRFVSTGNRQP